MQDQPIRGTSPLTQDDYIDSIKEQLIEVTFDWCSGADFETICKKTDSYEGSIIRSLRRLTELLKDLSLAAREIGNGELSAKFMEASDKVNRGMVVAASLYVL
jgi:ATP-dependent RNA helicase DOB1